MGIPKFFRWIGERYPLISNSVSSSLIPDFDNFYLDMNSIIHSCTHANQGGAKGVSDEEMFIKIFNYIEGLFLIIKPKKVFFMAIDGVAPRAKMNEQRSRRFKKVLEAEMESATFGSDPAAEQPFDSNCITPGTEFMEKLDQCLVYFINKKITEDKDWQDVKVIYSGYRTPGEGEHKILNYIRNIRSKPETSAHIRHCMYGLDADLIMLGLLSHEPHFSLLREVVTFSKSDLQKKKNIKSLIQEDFILFNLSLMREYLDLEFSSLKDAEYAENDIGYDLERILDDYILLCMLTGNDFMRHLPGVHVGESAISLLIGLYVDIRPKLGGYLHDCGSLDLERIQRFFRELSIIDVQLFQVAMDGTEWYEDFKLCLHQNDDEESVADRIVETRNKIVQQISTFARS
ncbi:hypothetical protein BB560_003119, partial [Smittium megazygosporum]